MFTRYANLVVFRESMFLGQYNITRVHTIGTEGWGKSLLAGMHTAEKVEG